MLFILAGACSKSSAPTYDIPSEARSEASAIFTNRCVPCHGSTGRGDGPASASLNPKPRKYSDKRWQASVTDEQLEKTIMYGGAAVGKSPAMPANPDLQSKPLVVKGLIEKIRAFGN